MTTLAFLDLSPMHIAVILVIALLIWGRRLPEVGRGMGQAILEFKKGLKGVNDDLDPNAGNQNNYNQQQLPPQQPAYRAPLGAAGEDPRVSRNDRVEVQEPQNPPAPQGH